MKYKREIGIGLIFIVALGLFIWGFNFLKGFNLFKEQRVVYAVYDQVSGLTKSNPVAINGLKVGQVSDIYFEPGFSGQIVVETDLPAARTTWSAMDAVPTTGRDAQWADSCLDCA